MEISRSHEDIPGEEPLLSQSQSLGQALRPLLSYSSLLWVGVESFRMGVGVLSLTGAPEGHLKPKGSQQVAGKSPSRAG